MTTSETQRDIEIAAKELGNMVHASNLGDLKTAWESFLFRLERAWEITERHVQRISGGRAQSWLSANAKLRRTDQLLQYLKQARNAETHGIAISVGADKVISIADRFGRPFNLENVTLSIEENTLIINFYKGTYAALAAGGNKSPT